MPKSLCNSSSAFTSYIAAVLQGLILYMALYYASFYFSAAQLFKPLQTGLSIFPTTTVILPSAALVSALITSTGNF